MFEHVLIVDDDSGVLQAVRAAITERATTVREAMCVADALEALDAKPDLILLDVNLPDGSGVTVAEHAAHLRPIPRLIILSGSATASEAFRLSQLGGLVYLPKPFGMETLTAALDAAVGSVSPPALARIDQLTGVQNRRGGEEALASEFATARRAKSLLGLALFDIDRFKSVNDAHGHHVGDEVLRAVTDALTRASRRGDTVVRWGGEELLVVLPAADLADAREFAERARRAVESIPNAKLPRVTVSAGVAALVPEDTSPDALVLRADAKLYEAKAAGRNVVR